jgi:hypothetical protein
LSRTGPWQSKTDRNGSALGGFGCAAGRRQVADRSCSATSPKPWPNIVTYLKLFGKPDVKGQRRMGVALAW